MFILYVLNDGGEWERCIKTFKTAAEAEAFFYAEMSCFADFDIEQI